MFAAWTLLPACGSDHLEASQAMVEWADAYCDAGQRYLDDSEELVGQIPDRDQPRSMLDLEHRKARAIASLEGANQVLEQYLEALKDMDAPSDVRWAMDVIIGRRERLLEVREEHIPAIREADSHSDFLLPDLAISIASEDVGYAYAAARQSAPPGSLRRIAAALAEAPACEDIPELANLPWLPATGFVAP